MESEVLKIASQAREDASMAKTRAEEANHKIDSYVKVNTLQYQTMVADVQKVEAMITDTSHKTWGAIDKINSRIWWAVASIVAALLTALGGATALIINVLLKQAGV